MFRQHPTFFISVAVVIALMLGVIAGMLIGWHRADQAEYERGYTQGHNDTTTVCWYNSAGSGAEEDYCKPGK